MNFIIFWLKQIRAIIVGLGVILTALGVFVSPIFLLLYLFPELDSTNSDGEGLLMATFLFWIVMGLSWLIGRGVFNENEDEVDHT